MLRKKKKITLWIEYERGSKTVIQRSQPSKHILLVKDEVGAEKLALAERVQVSQPG